MTGPEHDSKTILLVDDQPALRRTLRDLLRDVGCQILEAGSATEALAAARSHTRPIHLVLTRIVMPPVSGFELAERLAEFSQELKVIYLTRGMRSAILKYRGRPVRDVPLLEFLKNPYDPGELVRCVRRELRPGRPLARSAGAG